MTASSPTRVMLVDDHASLRRPLAFMIDREPDMTVVAEAGSVAEARDRLAAGARPDALILDLDLPDGNGIALIPFLRSTNPQAFALVLSGVVDARSRALAVAFGAGAVFPKTTDIEDIIRAIRRMCDGEVLISAAEALERLIMPSRSVARTGSSLPEWQS